MKRSLIISTFFVFCVISIPLSGCEQKSNGSNGGMPTIDIAGNLEAKAYHQVPMSEYISEVEYVPLETGAEFLIGGSAYFVTAAEDRIFVHSGDYCYVFTREGKFISNVGSQGRGPGEFFSIDNLSVDAKGKKIYINSSSGILEYSWDGEFLRTIGKTILIDEKEITPNIAVHLRDNLFLGGGISRTGDAPYSWVIFDDMGSVVKAVPPTIAFEKQDAIGLFMTDEPIFASSVPYLKEQRNDTLYSLGLQNEFIPEFVFDLGKYGFPVDEDITLDNLFDLSAMSIGVNVPGIFHPMVMSSENIFFSIYAGEGLQSNFGLSSEDAGMVFGVYDIRSGKTELLDRDTVSCRFGFVNDIDGGLSFWPQYYNESSGELVQILEAYQVKELLTEEYFAAHPAKDPAAHARLREMLANLKEDDNPVVVVAKLKK
jgi:hypothetical protein